jgi:hypothetical protein
LLLFLGLHDAIGALVKYVICALINTRLQNRSDFKPIFLQTGPAKRLLRTMKAVKEGRPLSQRATAALVRLYASEGFPPHDSLRLQPLKFREDAFPAARVVTRSLPVIPELMFVTGEQNAEEVAGRLEETPVVLVVRHSEAGEMEFLGYLTEADLRGVSSLLSRLALLPFFLFCLPSSSSFWLTSANCLFIAFFQVACTIVVRWGKLRGCRSEVI